MNRHATLLAAALGTALAAVPSLRSQEHLELGKMWTFENPPLEYWKQVYDFQATPEWLDKVRLASLRMASGCSASFVSPKGLVMTNHHCVRDMVAQAAPKGKDWVKDGFVAKSMEEEVRLPNCVLQQLVATKDVTGLINEGVQGADSDSAVSQKRDANQRKVLADATSADPSHTHQVVKLFQGAMFMQYSYKMWSDVRLVVAPNLQAAHFGGDPDNFVFPRYCIDFSFVRCYENDKPVDSSAHHFKWCTSGLKENELVFVTGNPGNTNRLKTLAQLEYFRDVHLPIQLQGIDNQVAIYRKHMAKDPEFAKTALPRVLGLENSQKAIRGYLNGLLDKTLMDAKGKAEVAFQQKVHADAGLKAKYGQIWSRLAEIAAQRRAWQARSVFHTSGSSAILTRAVALARMVKKAGTAQELAVARQLASEPLKPSTEFGAEMLTDLLTRARQHLGKDDAFLNALLAGEEPARAVQGILKSKMYDDATVQQLLDGDEKGLKELDDRVMKAVLVLLPLMDEAQSTMKRLAEEENAQNALLGQALFACYGTKISPDATFTLRISDGVTAGYPCNGTLAPWRTTFHGLYARSAEFDNRYPFDLAAPWVAHKDRIDMTKSLDFVSTNDIIGGNSGSPTINAKAEVVGLIFDGNMEMLPNNYLYRSDLPRSVSVHVDAILESLNKVYDAAWVANELVGAGA